MWNYFSFNWCFGDYNCWINIKQEIDGIFQLSLNEEGKCIYFKQWRFTGIVV